MPEHAKKWQTIAENRGGQLDRLVEIISFGHFGIKTEVQRLESQAFFTDSGKPIRENCDNILALVYGLGRTVVIESEKRKIVHKLVRN